MIPQYEPWIDREKLAEEMSNYILGDGFFTEYKKTQEFENRLAEFLGVQHCIVVANGTLSLSLALLAHGIKAGDLVVVPNFTMIATQNAVSLIGAKALVADIDPKNLCLNLEDVKVDIKNNPGTIRAVIYVTLNGRRHSVEELKNFVQFCQYNNVVVIEDNAQSLGSYHTDGSMINCPQMGIGSFSFSMPKIITTGQGGCLVTNSGILAEKLRKLKDFGRVAPGCDLHDEFGINCKFTEMSAIMGLNQLKDMYFRTFRKKEIYNTYKEELSCIPKIQFIDHDEKVLPWFMDIYVDNRESLQSYLKIKEGISTRAVYPELTSQKINGAIKGFVHSEYFTKRGLWLPSSINLQKKDVRKICKKIKEFYG